MKYKLIDTERYLSIYKRRSGQSVIRIEISPIIELETLKKAVNIYNDDKCLYDNYILTKSQVLNIIKEINYNESFPFDFRIYHYVLECFGKYDWNQLENT